MQITMEMIQQGIGGLVMENWALQREVGALQKSLASSASEGKPTRASEPSVEGKSGGEDQPTPLPPPESSGG